MFMIEASAKMYAEGSIRDRLLTGFPDNGVGVSGKGRITKKDYDTALIPRVGSARLKLARIACIAQV